MKKKEIEKEKDYVALHLGCGNNLLEGYTNVDLVEPANKPFNIKFVKNDVSDLGFMNNKTVDLILADFLLEHIPVDDVPYVLYRWNRVLKMGGIIKATVPDFSKIANAFVEGIDMRKTDDFNLYKKMSYHLLNPGKDAHGSLWTKEYAEHIFRSEGFQIIDVYNDGFHDWYLCIQAKKIEES